MVSADWIGQVGCKRYLAPVELGDAIKAAYKGLGYTQTQVAQKLGVQQNTISRWVNGENTPHLDDIKRLELAVGRPVGFVLRLAGYVEQETDVSAAIELDDTLSDGLRDALRSTLALGKR